MLFQRLKAAWLIAASAYAAWLGMMITHELGHALHAAMSAGQVDRINIPLVGFSQTILARNPRPVFVAWGGFIWGAALPLLGLMATQRWFRALALPALVLSVVALLANGIYALSSLAVPVGDTEDLLRLGSPRWLLILFGSASTVGSLLLTNRLIRTVPRRLLNSPTAAALLLVTIWAAIAIAASLVISAIFSPGFATS